MQELRGRWYAELVGEGERAQALLEDPPQPFSDLRLPESLREPAITSARKVGQPVTRSCQLVAPQRESGRTETLGAALIESV